MMDSIKTKVLLVSPYESAVGGITKWTHNIIDFYNQNNSGIYVEVLPVDREDNIKILKSKFRRLIGGIWVYGKVAMMEMAKMSNGFDIVHICSSASYGLLRDYVLMKIARWKGAKTVIHFHFGRIPEMSYKNNTEWKLLLRIARLADAVIVLDKLSYETLVSSGYQNVYKIPNPLDINIQKILNSFSSINVKSNNVLFVGHCYRDKGVEELVDACSGIADISLTMIGRISDEMKEALMKYDIQKNWIQIVGEQPYAAVIKEMSSCGVFVLPTYTEGFPYVILEAMACGCPIVTTNVGAIPEMLDIDGDKDLGICVNPKDVNSLRIAINKMLDDRPYAIKCGNNARRRVNDLYSMPKVWEQLVRLWTTL